MDDDDLRVFLACAYQTINHSSLEIDEVLDSSDSSDMDEDEEPIARIRNQNYYEIIVPAYSDADFKSHFRMNRRTMERLIDVLRPHWKLQGSNGRPLMSIEKATHMGVWYLSVQESYRQTGDRFNVERGNCYKICRRLFQTIYNLRRQFIKWPTTDNEIEETVAAFDVLRGRHSFKNVIGCVDGTHINVTYINPDYSYRDRHHNTSFKLQGICNSQQILTDIFFGYPGSVHDSKIWNESPIYRHLTSIKPLPRQMHILGDSAYPISNFLMKVYPTNEIRSDVEANFNRHLISTRQVIEQSFGRLKGKFRRLKNIEVRSERNVKFIVVSACAIHNFILLNENINEDIDVYGIDENNENLANLVNNYENIPDPGVQAHRLEGQRKRAEIANEMQLHVQ